MHNVTNWEILHGIQKKYLKYGTLVFILIINWEDLKTKFKSHNSFLKAELNMAKHVVQIG